MHLIQILLPIPQIDGASALYRQIRTELTDKFGGVTAFIQSPAEGLWSGKSGTVQRDDIVIVEVMTETLDREWWSGYRKRLEARLRQEKIVMRVQVIFLL
jgi:hypothetical protein